MLVLTMNATPTRPATEADAAPIDRAYLAAPRIPADIAALVVEMLEARKVHKLAARGVSEGA